MRPLRPTDPPQVGAFRLDGILGEGSQGTAYLATGPDGQLVALKLLHAHLVGDAEAQQRFLREVQVATRVARFSTAQVLTTGTASGRPFIVSEFVAGPTLEAAVARTGPRGGGAIDRLAIGTATALAAIHRAGVLHRDFKPANVIVSQDGPVVIDFGIARALDGGASGLTQTGLTVGTPAYMAPEQISDEQPGPASDIFSWACTIVFAATGQPPFPGSSVPGLFQHILHGEPDLGSMSGLIRDVVAACLAKDPAQRPTAEQLVAWLTGDAIPVHAHRTDETRLDVRHQEAPHQEAPELPHQELPHQELPHQELPHQELPHQELPRREVHHPEARQPEVRQPVSVPADPWQQSAEDLGTYLSGAHPADHLVPEQATRQVSVQPARRRLRRKPLVALIIVAVGVLAVGAGYVLAGLGAKTPSAAGSPPAASQAAVVTSPPAPTQDPAPTPVVPVPVGPDLLVNGSFGSGSLAPWHSAGVARVLRGGPRKGHMLQLNSAGGAGASVEEMIYGLRPGVTYKLTGLVASTGGKQTWLGVEFYDGPRSTTASVTTSSGWTEETMFFTPGPGHRTARIFCLRKPRGLGFCTAIVVRAMT